MVKDFVLQATARKDVGKGASRRLRRADKIPAIIYGVGKESQAVTLAHHALLNALKDEAFYTRILNLDIDGKLEKVVLKDLQRHPYKPQRVNHLDFQRISETEKIIMRIPLHFIGGDVAPGVKIDGGLVSHLMSEVEVRCLPKDLPERITVDISQLQLNQAVHLAELKLSEGVELLDLAHGENKPIVTIHIPREVIEPVEAVAAPEAEAAEQAEGEAKAAAEGAEKSEQKAEKAEKGKGK